MGGCELLEAWQQRDSKQKQVAVYLMWCLWTERNAKVFEGRTTPGTIILARVGRLVEEFNTYTQHIYGQQHPRPKGADKVWSPPPANCIKLNTDATLTEDGWVGMGVIARDHNGTIIFAATRRVKAWWSPIIAEGKAALLALKLARLHGLSNVIWESDCKVLMDRLSKASVYCTDLDNVLEDILDSCKNFSVCSWSHVKRDGNFVAHHLARLVPFGVEQVWVNHCPPEITPYVLMDNLSHD